MPQYNRSPPSAPRNARTINCSSTGINELDTTFEKLRPRVVGSRAD
jgi:hypothetical protein